MGACNAYAHTHVHNSLKSRVRSLLSVFWEHTKAEDEGVPLLPFILPQGSDEAALQMSFSVRNLLTYK